MKLFVKMKNLNSFVIVGILCLAIKLKKLSIGINSKLKSFFFFFFFFFLIVHNILDLEKSIRQKITETLMKKISQLWSLELQVGLDKNRAKTTQKDLLQYFPFDITFLILDYFFPSIKVVRYMVQGISRTTTQAKDILYFDDTIIAELFFSTPLQTLVFYDQTSETLLYWQNILRDLSLTIKNWAEKIYLCPITAKHELNKVFDRRFVYYPDGIKKEELNLNAKKMRVWPECSITAIPLVYLDRHLFEKNFCV